MHTPSSFPLSHSPRSFGASLLGMAMALAASASAIASPALPVPAPTVAVAHAPPALEANKHVVAGDLDVAYAELGPADGEVVVLLHGWPYDINAYAESRRTWRPRVTG